MLACVWSSAGLADVIYDVDVPGALMPPQIPAGICEVFSVTTVLDTTPPPASATYLAITGTQTGRLLRNGIPSGCAGPKPNPGANDTTVVRRFDRYRYTPGQSGCVTVTLNQPTTTLFHYALSDFNPAMPTSGYLADPGASSATSTYSLNVTAGTPVDLVVHEVNANGGVGSTYTLTVTTDACAVDADLSVMLVDDPDPVVAGNDLTITATVNNDGPLDAIDTAVTLSVPAGTSFVSATAAGGICAGSGPVVCTWSGATATGVVRSANLVVAVPADTAAGTVLTSNATVTSATPDPNAGNNSASASTSVISSADLSLTLTDDPDPVTAGAQLSYTATINNAGPSDATAVVVSLPTPAGVSFVSGTVSGGGSCAAGITCTVGGSIAPGTSRTVNIVVLVGAGVPDGTLINASANVSADSPDPDSGNNSANTTTAVNAFADLQISLTAPAPEVLTNVSLPFSATSTNLGPSDAQDVSLTMQLTPDFRYTSHTAAGATCTTPQVGTSGSVVCTWGGATTVGTVRTLTVVAFSNVEGNTAVNASTSSATTDPVINNNSAGISVVVGYPVNEIPTLGKHGAMLLGLLMGLMGFAAVRRRI